jgi:hypothetical protein
VRDAFVKWIFILAALLLVGPVCGWLMAGVHGVDGSHQVTALVSHTPMVGVVRMIAAIALAGAIGLVASRQCGLGVGLFCAGLAAVWAAGDSGTVVGVLNATRDPGSLVLLAIEGAGVTVLGGAVIFAICRTGQAKSASKLPEPSALTVESLYAIAAALLAGGFAAWFVAREGIKGQNIAAAAAAGAVGATVARVIAPDAARWVVASAPLLLGVIGPIGARFVHKDGLLDDAFRNSLFALARPAPLDWLAGTLIGAPLGLSWAASILHGRLGGETGAAAGASPVSS